MDLQSFEDENFFNVTHNTGITQHHFFYKWSLPFHVIDQLISMTMTHRNQNITLGTWSTFLP